MSGITNTGLGGTQPVSGTVAVSSVAGTVAVSGSVTVSGTVAATQSGTWTVGISAGQQIELYDGTNALGTFVNYGTSPGAVKVLSVNAFVTNTPSVNAAQSGSPWGVTGSKTNNNAAPGATNVGVLPAIASSAAPSWTDGNQVALSLDLTGNIRSTVNIASVGGSAVLHDGGLLKVEIADSSGTVYGAANLLLSKDAADMTGTAPGTAPSNTTIVGGIYNTAAPTATNGQTLPLQTDVNGQLKVAGTFSSASVGATGAAVPASADYIGYNSAGNLTGVSSANPFPVSLATSTKVIPWDNTNQITVKAASSSSVVADTSMVVQVSPNQPSALMSGTVPGTSPGNAIVTAGIYNSAAPTATTGQTLPLQQDVNGNLKTTISGALPAGSAVIGHVIIDSGSTTVVTGTVSTQDAATGSTGSAVPAKAIYVSGKDGSGNLRGVTCAGLTNANAMAVEIVDGSGNQITSFGGGTQYATGTAQATPTGTVALGWDGTAVRAVKTDASGILTVSQSGTWNIGTVTTITNAVTASASGGQTQGASVSGQGGILVLAQSLTTPPTYANNAMNTLTMDTGGNLRVTGSVSISNTPAVTVSGSVAVSQSGNWTDRIVGNAGATMDVAQGGATAATNALQVAGVYDSTAPVLTNGQGAALGLDSAGSQYINREGRKATYTMCSPAFTPKASASSPTFSIQGSGTKTIRISRIVVTMTGTAGTATPFYTNLQFQKFSALSGGITGSTPTGSKNDSANGAQSAVCLVYSTVPSTATAIGGITRSELTQVITATATAIGISRVEWDFGDNNQQAAVLRGTAEYFGVVIPTIPATAPICVITIEWTEE